MEFLDFVVYLTKHLDVVWTYLLLVIRFSAMMVLIPGIGMGNRGLRIRTTGIMAMAFASAFSSPVAPLPKDIIELLFTAFSEVLLGSLIGIIPHMIVGGVQLAGHLSSTTMGLGAGQLLDPTLGVSATSLSRIFGDLFIILFLAFGGHYLAIHAVAGLGGQIVPGTFVMGAASLGMLIQQSARIFEVGVVVSAPVIVALLLTQFVMGLISKAVPTVNIFIVSFPLTIGIGLVLSALSLPDVLKYMEHEISGIENSVLVVLEDVERIQPPAVGETIAGQ